MFPLDGCGVVAGAGDVYVASGFFKLICLLRSGLILEFGQHSFEAGNSGLLFFDRVESSPQTGHPAIERGPLFGELLSPLVHLLLTSRID